MGVFLVVYCRGKIGDGWIGSVLWFVCYAVIFCWIWCNDYVFCVVDVGGICCFVDVVNCLLELCDVEIGFL